MTRIVYGVGINDANYKVTTKVGNKRISCPFYLRWKCMLRRCYDPKYTLKNPTYIGCSVCDEWLSFMSFKAWMETQEWEGMHLDKDILIKGNKAYSPNTCMFITHEINTLLLDRGNARGKYPQGVARDKKMYTAHLAKYGKLVHIGSFKTVYCASKAYKKAKSEHIVNIAKQYKSNSKLYAAIMQYT